MHIKNFTLYLGMAAAVTLLPACAAKTVSGTPLPQLRYDHVAPLYVSAERVEVISQVGATAVTGDASSRLPTPPEVAIRRWAESRLQPSQGVGVLQFTINSATVTTSQQTSDSRMQRLIGQGESTTYDAAVRIGLRKVSDTRMDGAEHNMTVTRSVTIPDSWSIAQRESEMQSFVEILVADIDRAVTAVLQGENLLGAVPHR